jgi:hypothetical protein
VEQQLQHMDHNVTWSVLAEGNGFRAAGAQSG